MSQHTVRVDNGKYEFVASLDDAVASLDDAIIEINRGGRPWLRVSGGFNAIHAMMCELDAARVIVDAARRLGDDAPREIKLALARFYELVSDREPPSEWAR